MNRMSPYQESVYAVRQRYEDTSLVIFRQLQKTASISKDSTRTPSFYRVDKSPVTEESKPIEEGQSSVKSKILTYRQEGVKPQTRKALFATRMFNQSITTAFHSLRDQIPVV